MDERSICPVCPQRDHPRLYLNASMSEQVIRDSLSRWRCCAHHPEPCPTGKELRKEGAEIICDNCQDTIFGGFSPQSKTAEALSAALGSRTVLSGSVSQGKESSQSLQMMERPLMTPDELKSIPKGEFVVMKTGTHPMRTRLRLFLDWGITFDPNGYRMPERAARKIAYVNRDELARSIQNRRENSPYNTEDTK